MVNVDTLTVHHRIFKITASTVIRQRILILVLGSFSTIFNEVPSEEVALLHHHAMYFVIKISLYLM